MAEDRLRDELDDVDLQVEDVHPQPQGLSLFLAAEAIEVFDQEPGAGRDAAAAGQGEELTEGVDIACVMVATETGYPLIVECQCRIETQVVALAERFGKAVRLPSEAVASLLPLRGKAAVGIGDLGGRRDAHG